MQVKNLFEAYESFLILAQDEDSCLSLLLDSQNDHVCYQVGEGLDIIQDIINEVICKSIQGEVN